MPSMDVSRLPPPSEDPWYRAPAAYETSKPGTILRFRVAPSVKLEDYPGCKAIYNILFATTDSRYKPSWGVTTVFVPKTDERDALLSYQSTYNTVDVDGAISSLVHTLRSHVWFYIADNVSIALERGWYVNLPDHEGPDAGFGNGITTGQTTLDSIRAVLNAGFGMRSPRIGLWGFSGGAFATSWATELQPHYAPDLKFAGAALGGLPPTLECEHLSGGLYAALIPLILLGITKESPEAREYLILQLREEHREEFLTPLHTFVDNSVRHFANQDIWGRYFVNGSESLLNHPLIRKALCLARLGYHGIPETPLFIYKAIHDQNTPIETTDELVKRWGNCGVNIVYERNTVGDHVQEAKNGKERVIKFLSAILDGSYDHSGVTVRDVTINHDESQKDIVVPGEVRYFDKSQP